MLFVHLASSLDVIKRETTSAREFLKSCIAVKYRACTLHNSASNKNKMATSGFFEFFQLFFFKEILSILLKIMTIIFLHPEYIYLQDFQVISVSFCDFGKFFFFGDFGKFFGDFGNS